MKVFVMMCKKMSSGSDDLACDVAYIADDCNAWTNNKLPCGVTNSWTNKRLTRGTWTNDLDN